MGTQLVKRGDLYRGAFSTTGTSGSVAADSLPTAVLNRNGADDTSVAVTVAQISTSARYNFSLTVPTGYAVGDYCVVWVTAVVGGVSNVSPIGQFRLTDLPGSGTGPNATTITVTDGTNPIQAATVTAQLNATTFVATTDTSGHAAFSLLSGTYSIAIAATGYTYTPSTLAVTTNPTTATLAMTALAITPPALPGQTTGYTTTMDGQGNIQSHVAHQFQLVSPTSGDVRGNIFTVSSDNSGLLEVTLLQNQTYQFRRGSGLWITFTTGTASTFALPSVLGADAS